MAKKKRKRRRYKIKNILFLLLIISLLITFVGSIKDNKVEEVGNKIQGKVVTQNSYLNKVYKEEIEDDIDKDLEKKIIEYMDKYFKAMTTLKDIDMTYLFDDDSFEESYIHQTAISTLVNIRKLEKNDMKINNAKYDIIYKEINVDNDITTVTFLENDYLHFNFMGDIESKVYDIENTIVLKKINNSYKILKLRKVQDFYVMITNKYEIGKTKKKATKELDKIKSEYISDYKKQLKILEMDKKKYLSGEDKPLKKCDNNYNRKAALKYAKKYVINKNPKWMDYASVGGNCQNYASQVIYAGGVPMDVTGNSELQWKHYDSKLDPSSTKTGRSSSWTTVPYFYEYAKNNQGYGLCSVVDINPFYAEAGDVGQVGYDGNYRHSVVIIGNIKDENGKVIDLLINSNSVNLENYPLSGYVYPYKRIIKIFGWNN